MEVEPLPIPATPGPVEPPKARPAPWVYVLIALFIFSTLLALFVTLYRSRLIEEQAATSAVEMTDTSKDERASEEAFTGPDASESLPVYSYTSVSREVVSSAHYTGITEECFNAETNALSPTIERPAVVDEKTSLVVIVAIDRLEDLSTLTELVDIADAHKVKLTILVSPTFVSAANTQIVTELATWAEGGHEIGLNVDRTELFPQSEPDAEIPYGTWLLVLHEFQIDAEALCDCSVVTFADGGSFGRIFEVAHDLGFVVHVSPGAPITYQPWTPAVGGSSQSLESFDVFGSVVQVPQGIYPGHCQNPGKLAVMSDVGFSYITRAFYETLGMAEKGRVNVFSLMIDLSALGDLSAPDAIDPFDTWLTTVTDREVRSARLVSARTTDINTAYFTWLDLNFQNIEFVKK